VILQSQGYVSASGVEFSLRQILPKLGDLAARLQAPSAKFLDIGTGVAALSIAYCRYLPNLHAVGLEPQDAPLNEARRNIATVGLSDRIELRKQGIEDLEDKEAFDFAFFPQPFMSEDVVKRGLQNVIRALRPGGWIGVATVSIPGMDLEATLSRLRDKLWGGDSRIPSQVEAMLKDTGFISINTFGSPVRTTKIVVGQRPI
jgi:predicted O-methyltransferase YrrM